MSVADLVVLAVAGIAAGIVSTVAALASLVSYPVLLALGLPPLTANVTNTVSLSFTAVGAAAGSRPELAGQAARVGRLGVVTALGGAVGAAILLLTPASSFEAAAPVLIGGASLVLLLQPSPGDPAPAVGLAQVAPAQAADSARPPDPAAPARERSKARLAMLFLVAVYVGYFGAAGGILMLAVLIPMLSQPLARTNAVKNVINGLANGVAAIGFAAFGPVRWAAVLPLGAGFLIGGWIGPMLVRRIPGRLLQILIALGGVGLAVRLGLSAYG
ncbi:MAG TPA: sulfite exporter TauE/SafE family protein [Streptosporangiaceae bacterium]